MNFYSKGDLGVEFIAYNMNWWKKERLYQLPYIAATRLTHN